MFCEQCGAQNEDSARFCEKCGEAIRPPAAKVPVKPELVGVRVADKKYAEGKQPMLAVVLSLLPGLGQLYNGDVKKGIVIIVGVVVIGWTGAYILFLAGAAGPTAFCSGIATRKRSSRRAASRRITSTRVRWQPSISASDMERRKNPTWTWVLNPLRRDSVKRVAIVSIGAITGSISAGATYRF